MFYLYATQTKTKLTNLPQETVIPIAANGRVQLVSDLDWLELTVINTNHVANSLSDGRLNTDIINAFETRLETGGLYFTPEATHVPESFDIPSYEIFDNAAKRCLEYNALGYNDIAWFLPSINQLKTMLDNQQYFTANPFLSLTYWSSTEHSIGEAKTYSIDNNESSLTKSITATARPVTSIIYTTPNSPYALGEDVGYGMVFSVDTVTKTILIGSKLDIDNVQWGIILESTNANFTSGINSKVLRNNSYKTYETRVELSLIEDPATTFTITIIQESSAEDSQAVSLSEIVSNIVVKGLNERSYAYGIHKYEVILLAKRLMQEMTYNGLVEARVYEGPVTDAGKFIPPLDYVEYVRLSIVDSEGKLHPIFYNNKLNSSFQYILDIEQNIMTDDEGYPIKAQGSRNTKATTYEFATGAKQGSGGLYGMVGGQKSYTGAYKYDSDAKEFILDDLPVNHLSCVLEYTSDPILAEKNPERLRIHKFFQSTLEAGVYFMFISELKDVPSYEKLRARKEYYNEQRKARRRLVKLSEVIQKLGSDVGFNKSF